MLRDDQRVAIPRFGLGLTLLTPGLAIDLADGGGAARVVCSFAVTGRRTDG
ncbi:hypothetical protein BDK92_5788 [Micromonospora pisi]|uniref:Uncharacterized protein n=1 Tax=Micromonospora pisi TaxID=589240 RepID=A0A495JQZ6_9ACTN|nr:hypothetical protein [Micromonospora pisi]RKR91393.1 hypothetical protein BDK92_5788 [Micromonospora pisi]